jgi:hypothetical protein
MVAELTELTTLEKTLIQKIRQLPQGKVSEVETFIDFLSQRREDEKLTLGAMKLSEEVLREIWDNPDDAEYDNL